MSNVKDILIGLPLLGFVVWVFLAPLPQDRIVRGCEPINWVGNLTTSATALSSGTNAKAALTWSDKLNYSCQYMVWRLMYQDDYNKAKAAGLVKETPMATTPAATSGSAQDPAKEATAAKPGEVAPKDASTVSEKTAASVTAIEEAKK